MNKKKLISILAGIMAVILLLGLVAFAIPLAASAASSSELKEEIKELKKQEKEIKNSISSLKEKISDNMSEMEKIVAEKNVIDQEIALLHQQIDNVNQQILTYSLLIADKQDELDAARARYEDLNQKYKDRIRAMEENGKLSYWSVLFKANSFADLLDRLNMIEEIAAADHRRLQELNDAASDVAAAQAALETEKAELVETKDSLTQLQTQLEEKRAETDELLIQLIAVGQEYQEYIEEHEQKMTELSEELAQKNKELEAAKKAEYLQWLSTSVPPTTKPKPTASPSTVTPPSSVVNGLTWVTPVRYIMVTSPYGMRIHPIHGRWAMHTGIDLAARMGQDIVASRSGVVTTAGWDDSYGNFVIINHGDGFTTLYAHMSAIKVSVGQNVGAGNKIGEVGSTGASTGPHLHFEVRYNGATQNPASYIRV